MPEGLGQHLDHKVCGDANGSPSNQVVITRRGSDGRAVVDPFVTELESRGFVVDGDKTGGTAGLARMGFRHELLGVSITSSVRNGQSHVTLSTYAACLGDSTPSGLDFTGRLESLVAGESDSGYCASLRSILSDGDAFAITPKQSTTTDAPKELLDALARARAHGGKVTLFTPAWGPAKGDPKRWASATYANTAYDGARARLQATHPQSPPIVAFVGGQRLGFFSPKEIWIGP